MCFIKKKSFSPPFVTIQVIYLKNRNGFTKILLFTVLLCVFVQGVMAGECYQQSRQWDIGDPIGYDLAVAPGIAVDASGNTYVSTLTVDQSFSGSIEKIGSDGISSPWGPSYGIVEGTQTYRFPLGIVVDSPRNFVFVTEMDIDTVTKEESFYVHKFTLAGTEAAPRWEPYGTGTFSGFNDPFSLGLQGAIALDPTGSVYVTSVTGTGETSSGRVLVFNQEGDTLSQWNNEDLSDAAYLPMGIAIDSAGNVYISGIQKSETTTVSRIFKFNQNGGLLSQWEVGSNPDTTNFVTGITVDSEGYVYVNQIESTLDGMTTFAHVLKFDSGGEIINRWIIGEPATGSIDFPMGIVVDAGGHVYVSDLTLDMDSFSFSIRVKEFISEYCENRANLIVSKYAPLTAKSGKTVMYTLYYHNFGKGSASTVLLEDFLDPSVTFIKASSMGEYNVASHSVKWELGPLEMGDYWYQNVTVNINPGVEEGKVIVNKARISTPDPEMRLDDNEAIVGTRVAELNLPLGVTMETATGSSDISGNSIPRVNWESQVPISYRPAAPSDPNCIVTGVSYHITDSETHSVIDGEMVRDTNDPDLWNIPPITFYPMHGKAFTTLTVHTSCNPPDTIKFSFYIDPAGYVYDVSTGERIPGASVWLQRPDGNGGWANVPIGETPAVMLPDINPIITNPDGQYQWDVLEGSYRVHVEAPGYSPADSIVVSIPPPVTDLYVGLKSIAPPNVPPSVDPITAPIVPVLFNTEISVQSKFSDPNSDTYTANWDWGDGNSNSGSVNEGPISAKHFYTSAGVYTITLTVTDNHGGAGRVTYQYVVVYDPNGGFVTGGGWINSPPGAYAQDAGLAGKATFGFVSKYLKGQTIPTGNTEFQFHVANMNFKSTKYDWLVIAGPKAQYKGNGTINGAGNYGFMLTGIDGQINGGGGIDKFRIKIWNKDLADVIVYDNQMGKDDAGIPTTSIAGGQIVIHK
jgi:uncharacterized repeat protein (TIGR01451 family)